MQQSEKKQNKSQSETPFNKPKRMAKLDFLFKKSNINDFLEPLVSSRQVRRTKFDPDSPRFREACKNLQIDTADIELKTRIYFEDQIREEQKKSSAGIDMTKELSAIRYSYHLQSVKEFLNDIIYERQRIVRHQRIRGTTKAESVMS